MIKKYNVYKEDFQNAGMVSSDIKHFLKGLNLDADLLRRISIATYEAEINMIIHSEGGIIRLEVSDEDITIVFDDKGPGIKDIELALKPGYSTASNKAREFGFGAGMGLSNIKRVADYFDLNSRYLDKSILTIKFKVNS